MCQYSVVMDHFKPRFDPFLPPAAPVVDPVGADELRKLIDDFRAALEAAKKLDKLMKQPDCVDPEKAKLVKRVAALERKLHVKRKRRRQPM